MGFGNLMLPKLNPVLVESCAGCCAHTDTDKSRRAIKAT
ncbi:hypothetical protein JCM19301_518 [Jejuia pallidilutea]|uniref:Uncharacterized protein n=1 Tax=Jejuia pallidilutea TaxID=504487 RepID=A0A090VPL4_9FLAO|nr:hypothetical protein JCM19301_518 [Jejuia pallidilutea]